MKTAYRELGEVARRAMLFSHAPYSKFRVGAALLAKSGRVFTGCNIESSSYSLTICAERTAIFKAISEGVHKFTAIAIASVDPGYITPCGACRQVLFDLAGNIDVVLLNGRGKIKVKKVKSLIPLAFSDKNLTRAKSKR
jgi:cytidine deaminase